MKRWIKVLIIISVAMLVIAVTVGLLMGMSHVDYLSVDYAGEVKEYRITRSNMSHILSRIRYGGSYASEYQANVDSGMSEVDAMSHISRDFDAVILDMRAYEKDMIESKVDFVNDENELFRYSIGEDGRVLRSDAYQKVVSALDNKSVAIGLYDDIAPTDIDELKRRTTLIGSFTTEYKTSGDARRKNIHIATDYLNGSVITSGDRLSFNEIVGERTSERGFLEAKVIQNGEYISGIGGGVCQVSTTLYNAWVLSGLGVIYATSHSLPPHYVDLSRDAMVSSYNDMILLNNSKYPIYVRSFCGIDDVTFEIYGTDDGMHYEIESNKIEDTPITDTIVGEVGEDEEYDEIVLRDGLPGHRSNAHRIAYDKDGNIIHRELLREDEYKCQPRIIKRVRRTA